MDKIIDLAISFREFYNETSSQDLLLFAEWLKQKYADSKDYQTDKTVINEAGIDVMASYLLGGLASYVEAWVKLTFDGIPLLSLGDFGIVQTVLYRQTPSKSEIAEEAIMEKSTCIEAIKRLVKSGILEEFTDTQDKRVKRVKLTEEGLTMIQSLEPKMMALGSLFMGNLSETEKKSIIPILKKLNDFHNFIYKQKSKEEIKKSYGI